MSLEKLAELFREYNRLKAFGWFSSRLGNNEAMRKMRDIRNGLKALGTDMKELRKISEKDP
jgi:hypothetical protein